MPLHVPILIKSQYDVRLLVSEDLLTYRYQGIHVSSGRSVCVWEFKSEWLSAHLIQDLIQQADALIQVEHPGLVSILDYDYDGEQFLVVTDSLDDAQSLDLYFKQSSFSLKQRWVWSKSLLSVLAYLESMGFYHGALSHRMIWIYSNQSPKIVMPMLYATVIKRLFPEVNVIDGLVFLAPEIIQFQTVNSQSDMYSMGVLMFRFFSRSWPYPYTDFVQEHKQHLLEYPRSFDPCLETLPEKLTALICRCLMKDSVNRFVSFSDLAVSYKLGENLDLKSSGESVLDRSLKNELKGKRYGCLWSFVRGLIIILVLIILLGVGWYFSRSFFDRIPDKRIPDVVGLKDEDAQMLLKELGFDSEVVGGRFHMSLPVGSVVSTQPPPGRDVKINRRVKLFTSMGIPQVIVPNFVGRSLEHVENLAAERQHGIEVTAEVYSTLYAKGIVIRQSPTPNTFLTVSQNVQVEVSKGYPVSFSVENVEPWSVVKKAHFKRIRVTFQVLDTWPDQDVYILFRYQGREEVLYRQRKISGSQDTLVFELELGGVIDFYFNDELVDSFKVEDS